MPQAVGESETDICTQYRPNTQADSSKNVEDGKVFLFACRCQTKKAIGKPNQPKKTHTLIVGLCSFYWPTAKHHQRHSFLRFLRNSMTTPFFCIDKESTSGTPVFTKINVNFHRIYLQL